MLEGENIICFSSTEWVGRNKTSKRCLMEILSRSNRVLFVETIGSRNPGMNRMHLAMILKRLGKCLRGPVRPSDLEPDQQLWVYSPIVIPFFNIAWVRKLNQMILICVFRSLIRKLKLQNPILWFYLPTASDTIGYLDEKKVIYHAVDEWSTYPGFRGGAYQEMDDQLFRKSDIVFASNRMLLEKKKIFNKNSYYLPHGVNFTDYETEPMGTPPLDLCHLPRPVIGMIGAVSSWIDWGPLIDLAKQYPKGSIVMIGPIGYDAQLQKIQGISNIYLLGPKNYSDLPTYYKMIDICVVSFLLTEHIRYCCPTRLYEHLANGKPVVTTDFPAAHEFPADLVKVAKSRTEFLILVQTALSEVSTDWIERRKKIAQHNTWKDRAETMSELILKEKL